MVAAEISTLRDGFVAEVTPHGRPPHDDAVVTRVQEALRTHAVIVIRGQQGLSALEQAAFTRLLGPLEPASDMRNHHPDSTDVMVVDNSGTTPVVGNQCWHSDRSFLPEPTRYTVLSGQVIPASGSETLFADMAGAYRGAPEAWRRTLRGATGVHSYDKLAHMRAAIHNAPVQPDYARLFPPVRHPLVRLHPESGTAAFYLSELCLARIEPGAGDSVDVSVEELHAHATRPESVYRHAWSAGDLVIWDNCRVMHRAGTLTPGPARILYRTTTAGGAPEAYVPA
ncbi:TauD/TfdA family dioxygenase [Sphaerisporangium rubeum]|uniref:Taurine dioxygenase n=1 Tax=Sphaerisporangium rubeum TaxID=321317 RepID=A0A7X0IHY4_9ACTN|nr:taurine dioxygenase [Sphaerisporangium rubeum]